MTQLALIDRLDLRDHARSRLFMVALDNLVVTTALPVIRARPRRVAPGARVDGQRLHADLRRAAADRRRPRRPVRPPPHVRHRPDHLHGRLGSRRRSRRRSDVLILARAVQGVGGAIVTPLSLTILSAAVPPQRRAARARRVGRHRRPRDRHRPARRRRHRPGRQLALDLLAQRARRHRRDRPRLLPPRGDPRTRGPARPPRPRASPAPACWASCGASSTATTAAGPIRRSSPAIGVGALLLVGFVAWERARRATRCCRSTCSAAAAFAAANTVVAADVLRDVRLDLPAVAVLPGRPGPTTRSRPGCGSCRGRRCRPSSRRSPGYFSGRIGARPILVAGPRADVDRARAGSRPIAAPTAPYIAFVPAVHRQRHRAWACSSPRSPTSSCRPSGREEEGKASGREQRDPRGRRRVRRRRAGVRVLGQRLVREPAGLRRRAGPGGLASGRRSSAVAAVVALAIPGRIAAGEGLGQPVLPMVGRQPEEQPTTS